MIQLAFYDPRKTYIYPNLQIATPEHIQMNYSAVNVTKCVIETDEDGAMFFSVSPFSAIKTKHKDNLDYTGKTDDEVLQIIEDFMNKQQEPTVPEPTAEERIASALEYQNIMM